MRWTVEDEIQLHKWIEAKGFKIVYLPQVAEWGYIHPSEPTEIIAGFNHLSKLKQYFANMKGDNKNVLLVSEGDFKQAIQKEMRRKKLH